MKIGFKKKPVKSKGRKAFEMGTAAAITGVLIPSIYSACSNFFERNIFLGSLSLEDIVSMDDEEDEEWDEE